MKIKYYDKISKKDLNKKTIDLRLKDGLKETICVYMSYKDYEELKKKNTVVAKSVPEGEKE